MLNMGIANVSPPPPPSAGPTVRVCRYVMEFDVVLESVCEISMRHKTLRPYVITWEKAQKAAFSPIFRFFVCACIILKPDPLL